MKRILSLLVAACTAMPAAATTLFFDFGNTGQQTLDPGWNNVIYPNPDPAPPLAVVVDSTGAVVPGVTLEVTDQFFINGPPSQLGTESPSGDAAIFPVSAADDYFFGHTGPFAGGPDNQTGAFKLTGLVPGQPYDFTFLSSRTGVNDLRETAYTVTGANSDSGLLEAANNDSNVLDIVGILPDGNNEITVQVSAGPNNSNGLQFYYLNAVRVTTIPEPSAIALAGLVAGLGACRTRRR